MASIHRSPRSKFYYAAWRTAAGKLVMRSTKHTDKAKAMAFALDMEQAERLGTAGTLTETAARDILSAILKRSGSEDTLRNPSCADWLREWIKGLSASATPSTVARYTSVAEQFIKHVGPAAARPLSAITKRHVQGFLAHRATEDNCSDSTVQIDGKILRSAFETARRDGIIAVNPASQTKLPTRDTQERGIFTPAEVKMLVDAAEGEWKTIILLGFYCGARLGDCVGMKWADVSFTHSTITYESQKTGTRAVVPLHPDLHAHLESIAGKDTREEFLSPGMAGMTSGGRHGLSETFKVIMRKAGLDLQSVDRKRGRKFNKRTFHALRHSFVSALANAGVSAEVRMEMTGHASPDIHQGYTHASLETLKAAIGKLPRLVQPNKAHS